MTWKVRSLCLTTMVLVNKAPGEDAKISYVPKGHSAFSVWICNHMRLNLLKKIAYTFMSSFINSGHSNSKLIVFTVLHPNVRNASIVCVCVCLRWSAYVSVPDLFCLKEWTFLQLLRTQQCVNSGLPACRRILFPLLHEGKGKSSLFHVQQRKWETSARGQNSGVCLVNIGSYRDEPLNWVIRCYSFQTYHHHHYYYHYYYYYYYYYY